MIEHLAYSQQQICVNALAAKYIIHIASVAVQLMSEPGYSAFLSFKFPLYQASNMNF